MVVPPVHEEHGVQVKGVAFHLSHNAVGPLVPRVKLLIKGHQLACVPCTDSRSLLKAGMPAFKVHSGERSTQVCEQGAGTAEQDILKFSRQLPSLLHFTCKHEAPVHC